MLLVIVYLGMSIYFREHFYFRTKINGVKVTFNSVEEANENIIKSIERYEFQLEERGDKKEFIVEEDIGLKYEFFNELKEIMANQNSFLWIFAIFKETEHSIKVIPLYDEELLEKSFNMLEMFNPKEVVEPTNALLNYQEGKYEILKEEKGNKVKKENLYEYIINAISERKRSLNLEELDCYLVPKYTSESTELIQAKEVLNQYMSTNIIYKKDEHEEILNGEIINSWINISDEIKVSLNKDKLNEYINKLADTYDGFDEVKEFTVLKGEKIKVINKEYITIVDREKEIEFLLNNIKSGKSMVKDVFHKKVKVSESGKDLVNTYVQIDLTNQYIYFYKDGKLLTEGPIVTGNISTNHTTPPGIFKLDSKARKAVLRGVGYSAPVDFWMPFNGGIGIHDATWRDEFGRDIYITNGSHGCINTPYNVVKIIYNNIKVGDIIICHQ